MFWCKRSFTTPKEKWSVTIWILNFELKKIRMVKTGSSNLFYIASRCSKILQVVNCSIFRRPRYLVNLWDGSSAIARSCCLRSKSGMRVIQSSSHVTPLVASHVAFQQRLPFGLSSKGLRGLKQRCFPTQRKFPKKSNPHPTGLLLRSQQKVDSTDIKASVYETMYIVWYYIMCMQWKNTCTYEET